MWCPLPPTEHRQVTRQGKGGVKQETFTYTLSYAILFLRGQSYGYRWIKRNGKVVYTTDPNATVEDAAYAAKWAERVTFHNGTVDQLPDALIEAHEGVGNVSGFPLDSFIVIEDEDVTDNGGAPPNYEAVIIASPPEAYLTSLPYAQAFTTAIEANLEIQQATITRSRVETNANDATTESVTVPAVVMVEVRPIEFDDSSSEIASMNSVNLLEVDVGSLSEATQETASLTSTTMLAVPNGTPSEDTTQETITLNSSKLWVQRYRRVTTTGNVRTTTTPDTRYTTGEDA